MSILYVVITASLLCGVASEYQFLEDDPGAVDYDINKCPPLDIGLILDASGSIGPRRFQSMLQFIDDVLRPADLRGHKKRIAAITFSRKSVIEFLFNTHINKANPKNEILNNIAEMVYTKGVTNTSGALRTARETVFNAANGDREDIRNVAMVITDGNSNLDEDPIQVAKKLKKDGVYIFGIAVGYQKSIDDEELKGIATNPNLVLHVKDYNDLVRLRRTIVKRLCDPLIEKPLPTCSDGDLRRERCRQMQCENGEWQNVGYNGCCYKGRVLAWDDTMERDCDTFKCSKAGNCSAMICSQYTVSKVDDGCMLHNGQCIKEDEVVEKENRCAKFQCIAGVYRKIEKECIGPDGNCHPIGYTYEANCTTFQCVSVENGVMVEFRPIATGCLYKDICYGLGDRYYEGCETLVCAYDEHSKDYDMMLEQQGCPHEGSCKSVGEVWMNNETCIRYQCAYSTKRQKTVIRERVIGCQENGGCIAKGTERGGCIKYECNNKGEFELIAVGCEVGSQCYRVNQKWRSPPQCASYVCKYDENDDGTPNTYIETIQECLWNDGTCHKVGDSVYNENMCLTLQCMEDGSFETVEAGCRHGNKCYAVGKKWIDDITCERLTCEKSMYNLGPGTFIKRVSYGCVDDEGECFRVGAYKYGNSSCLKYQCYSDHTLRQEVCEHNGKCYNIGQHWVDEAECLNVFCKRDDDTGEATIDTEQYGCFHEGICRPPGFRYEQDCQTFKCEGGGYGFSKVNAACPWRNGCKQKDEKWFDMRTCVKYGCVEDGDDVDVVEMAYGCRPEGNVCLRKGNQYDEGCLKYRCYNGTLNVISNGCDYRDRCLAIDEKYFDEENCVQVKCVVTKSSFNSIETALKERWGCVDYGKCYLPTQKKVEDCVTYQCRAKTRSFEIIQPDCEWRGKCVPANSTWESNNRCVTFRCGISKKTGLPVVFGNLWGCRDHYGKCHAFGTEVTTEKCVTSVCEKRPEGPAFYPVGMGCVYRRRCKKVDTTWVNKRQCVRQSCQYEPGSSAPEISNSPYGCKDNNNRCRGFGYKMADPENSCVKYECTSYEIFSPVQVGCKYKGSCKNEGAKWVDEATCTKYKCERENVGPSKVIMHKVKFPGCKGLNGECIKEGDIVNDRCTKYQCRPNQGGLVPVSEGCRYKGYCKAVNSSWFDDETCTRYSCRYDEYEKDISIVEISGCKDDGGMCFSSGKRKKEGCNKFLCTKNDNFKPIKMGCEYEDECKDVGASWVKGCVKFSCQLVDYGSNYVQTNVKEQHGCVNEDGKCILPGQSFVKDCTQFTCKKGGKLQETDFGCKDSYGNCVRPGDFVKRDCVKYVCDDQSKTFTPIQKECEWKGECKPVGINWFDKETCMGYKCVYDIADDDVTIQERASGCSENGECRRTGLVKNKDCIRYRCTKDGTFALTKVGCEWDGKCIPVGKIWIKNCIRYKCVITEEGPNYVQTEVRQQRGCYDSKGRCYSIGDEVSFGCNRYKCSTGGSLQLIKSGCLNKYGRCMQPGNMVEYADGSQRKCVCDGDSCKIITKKTGCKLNDVMYPLGSKKRNGCTVFECQKINYGMQFVPIEWGCFWDGKCYSPGKKWTDRRWCMFYQCTMIKNPNGDVDLKVTRNIGCAFENDCMEDGEVWQDGCFEKRCKVRASKSNNKESIINIISGGCQEGRGDSMICHRPDSKWEEIHYDGCFKKKCIRDGDRFITVNNGAACRDAYGKCQSIGSSGFEAMVNGRKQSECTCLKYGEGVRYKCKDDGTIKYDNYYG